MSLEGGNLDVKLRDLEVEGRFTSLQRSCLAFSGVLLLFTAVLATLGIFQSVEGVGGCDTLERVVLGVLLESSLQLLISLQASIVMMISVEKNLTRDLI